MGLRILEDLLQGSAEWHDQRRGLVTASVVGKLISVGPPDAASVACPTCPAKTGPCLSMARKEPTPVKTIHDARLAAAAELPPVYSVADNDTSRAITATLAAERITGYTEDTPLNRDMYRGVWSEPFARDLYAEHFTSQGATVCDEFTDTGRCGHSDEQHDAMSDPLPVTEVGFMVRDEKGWTLGYSPDGLVGDDGLIEIKAPRSKTHLLTVVADEVPAHYMAQCQAGLLVSGRKWIDFVSYVGGMHIYVQRVTPDPRWFAAIEQACRTFETNAAALVADYSKRVKGRPVAPRIDFDLEVI